MGISKLRGLPGDGFDHARMLMPETGNGSAAAAIENPPAIFGNQPHAIAADGPGRCFAQASMQHAAVAGAHDIQPFLGKILRRSPRGEIRSPPGAVSRPRHPAQT